MTTTLCTLLLAGASILPGAGDHGNGYGYGYGTGAAYGGYGSYGSYGMLGDERVFPMVIPYYVYPQAYAQQKAAPKAEEAVDRRMEEMKKTLGVYEEKVRELEQKLGEVTSQKNLQEERLKFLENSQTTLLGVLEKNQAKLLASVEEKLTQGVAQLETKLKTVEDKLQSTGSEKIAGLTAVSTGPSLEERLARLEKLILEKLREPVPATNTSFTTNNTYHTADPGKRMPRKDETGIAFNHGMIIVSLPADAKLFLDNQPSAVGSNLRTFISPELELGKNYFYTLKVEVFRNGKNITETQRVYFQPGREVRVSFDHLDHLLPGQIQAPKTTITAEQQP